MRSETEMIGLIVNTANKDDRVRAVYLTGSRANPNAIKDDFQDYDVIYVVTETKPYYGDPEWIAGFGDILYMHKPEECDKMMGVNTDFDRNYGWHVIFTDGTRLDLHVIAVSAFVRPDKVHCHILVDKDGLLKDIPEFSDEYYCVKVPAPGEYYCVCSEFWWNINNVAKGILRYEISYAQDIMNDIVRPQLISMLSWKIGVLTDFKVSVGKSGKYMNRWLSDDEWEQFLSTYSSGFAGEMKQALKLMCDMFGSAARYVGDRLGYNYNEEYEQAALKYLSFLGFFDK